MFRKQAHMIPAWEKQGPEVFAKMQREILNQAAELLKPGGMMLYSTCTFSELENEGSVDGFLKGHPDFHLADIPWYEGFCPGNPALVKSAFHWKMTSVCFRIRSTEKGIFWRFSRRTGSGCRRSQSLKNGRRSFRRSFWIFFRMYGCPWTGQAFR